jgi:hypothetical protein
VKLCVWDKNTRIRKADYIFEDFEKFESLRPYLKPKLKGEWAIVLVDTPVGQVRKYIKDNTIPGWLNLSVYLERQSVEQLVMEFPRYRLKELTPWEKYIELIKEFNIPMEDKAMKEIYYRAGPSVQNLADTLEEFKHLDFVRMSDVDGKLPPVRRVYAKEVLLSFLRNKPYSWKRYSLLEEEIGIQVSFYAMRKYVRKLFFEKANYLTNKPVKDKAVYDVDVYRIIHAYFLFEEAVSYKQLPAILSFIERRTMGC